MKIGLGTVQFGLDYGISNKVGRTPEDEVSRILDFAAQARIRVLDTASRYGVSEAVLGRTLPASHGFSIVTKTPAFDGDRITAGQADELDETFRQSLRRLAQGRVYGLMIHRAMDLLIDGGERLYERMQLLRNAGLVGKIGVSAYTASEIDGLLARYRLDLIQVPVNVLDQRLVGSGHLDRLKDAGVEVHARSAFLQGLLLMTPESLPPYFDGIRDPLRRYLEFIAASGLSPLQAALAFVQSLPQVDVVVCGVNDRTQLEAVCDAAAARVDCREFARFAVGDERMLNPSLWRQ